MRLGTRWLWCVALSAAAHGVALVGLSRAALEKPASDRPPVTMSIEILSPVVTPRPSPRPAPPSAIRSVAHSVRPESSASSPPSRDAVSPETALPVEVSVATSPAATSGVVLGLSGAGVARGEGNASGGAAPGGDGDNAEAAARERSATCWADIDRDLQARAQSRVPRALQQRGLVGRATVRLTLDDQGRAQHIRFESLEGSPLITEAVRAILAEPFAHACVGETRWRVSFERRRP
jgi:outer membrane biosynthesis protein TonB